MRSFSLHAPLADRRRIQYNVDWFDNKIFTLIWKAVQALLAGTLAYDPDTVCAHHHSGHEEGHTCAHGGENGCQHGSCGA